MKKLFAIAVACVLTMSATAQNWEAGLRLGSGFQAQAAYNFANKNAVEARFGMNWMTEFPVIMSHFEALYLWNAMETPKGFFLQSGVGIGVGGRPDYVFFGPEACVKFGYKFNKVPVKLAIDWSPILGIEAATGGGSQYFTRGLANVSVSCVFCF